MEKIGSLLAFVVLMACAGFFGSRFGPGDWYAGLTKPPWNPPNWVFGPVWTALYIAIAVAGWRVWLSSGPARRLALGLWLAQWALNALWSWLFFGLHHPGAALVEIVILWLVILAFTVTAHPLSRAATYLFVPYLLWVSFATALNAAIWHLNRGGS
jgi:tryptophan-rich sensory protein